MRSAKTVCGGNSISFYRTGKTTPTALLVHGNSFSGKSFERQFNSDLARKIGLVAIDLPGHGNSPPPSNPEKTYCLPGYARILCQFIEELDLREVILVGWSLGGHIALEAASNNPQVSGYLVFGTPPLGKPLALDKAVIPHPALKILFDPKPRKDDVIEFVKAMFNSESTPPQSFGEDFLRTDGSARSYLGKSLAAGSYTDEIQIVADLAMPLGIIHGENDPYINVNYFGDLNMPTLWKKGMQIIHNAGHAPFYEQPEAFNSVLEAFVRHALA